MTNPINIIMALVLLLILCVFAAAMQSPDVLDIWARKMRARARAIRVSRQSWVVAYNDSMAEDVMREQERRELASLIGIELRDGR